MNLVTLLVSVLSPQTPARKISPDKVVTVAETDGVTDLGVEYLAEAKANITTLLHFNLAIPPALQAVTLKLLLKIWNVLICSRSLKTRL